MQGGDVLLFDLEMGIVVGSDNLALLSYLYHKAFDVLLDDIFSDYDDFLPSAINKHILDLIDHSEFLHILSKLITFD